MAISAAIVDGKIYAKSTPDNLSQDTKGTSTMGKDQFLKILVAEMQYQDPLEPTTNTEWVSQMATFSQIEELQNMSDSMTKGQAQNLVGKYVIMATTVRVKPSISTERSRLLRFVRMVHIFQLMDICTILMSCILL